MRVAAAAMLALLCCAAAASAEPPLQVAPRVSIFEPGGAKRASVRVEIADDEASRERGLMFRAHMDEDAGMIFVFKAPEVVYFWMKNTEIPLDMLFADSAGRIVGIVANAEPYSERPVGPDADSQYVLEVNGGFCARHGVRVGDRMRFVGFEPRASD